MIVYNIGLVEVVGNVDFFIFYSLIFIELCDMICVVDREYGR